MMPPARSSSFDIRVYEGSSRLQLSTAKLDRDGLAAVNEELRRLDKKEKIGIISISVVAPKEGTLPRQTGDVREAWANLLVRLRGLRPVIVTFAVGRICGREACLLLAGDVRGCHDDTTFELVPSEQVATGLSSQLAYRGIDPARPLSWIEPMDAAAASQTGLVHSVSSNRDRWLEQQESRLLEIGATGLRALRRSIRAAVALPHEEAIRFDQWLEVVPHSKT